MEVMFKTPKMKRICEEHKKLQVQYGQQAKIIIQRINELIAADHLYDIFALPQTGFHKLTGNYKDCFTVNLKHPFRMIFIARNGVMSDLKSINSIEITEICTNYH